MMDTYFFSNYSQIKKVRGKNKAVLAVELSIYLFPRFVCTLECQ